MSIVAATRAHPRPAVKSLVHRRTSGRGRVGRAARHQNSCPKRRSSATFIRRAPFPSRTMPGYHAGLRHLDRHALARHQRATVKSRRAEDGSFPSSRGAERTEDHPLAPAPPAALLLARSASTRPISAIRSCAAEAEASSTPRLGNPLADPHRARFCGDHTTAPTARHSRRP